MENKHQHQWSEGKDGMTKTELNGIIEGVYKSGSNHRVDPGPLGEGEHWIAEATYAAELYAADKVREALDRIEGQEGEIEMWQVITEIRKEIE